MQRVTVLVIGDLGRSPRMQYHALALAAEGFAVDLVGHTDHALFPTVAANKQIHVHSLGPTLRSASPEQSRARFLIGSLAKVLRLSWRLGRVLLSQVGRPNVLLVQTPPAQPALLIAWLAARLRGAQFIIDWHNFGHSILALRLGKRHLAVRLSAWYERVVGRRADAHLCVLKAMRDWLAAQWRLPDPVVLYDRPACIVGRTGDRERSTLLRRLADELQLPTLSNDRAPLIVSPTSWTADEQMDLLLDAVVQYNLMLEQDSRGSTENRRITPTVLITGQGPGRLGFEALLAETYLTRIAVRTLWLSYDDYWALLGAADLGLCMHRSASGVDLPMKVSDMFGAHLPVGALDYGRCLSELVRDGVNGFVFSSAAELADRIHNLFDEHPHGGDELDRLRHGVRETAAIDWQAQWRSAAAMIFRPRSPADTGLT